MKKLGFIGAAVGILAAGFCLEAGAQGRAELPARYRQWLDEEAVYIIGPKEKEVFLGLATDRERDLFIEAFWKQRDPTPGTERNEFREEHYRRLAHANSYFGRGGIKPGWKTDRGRIYITLGPPRQDLVYDQKAEVVPVEVWYYDGLSKFGLPDQFLCAFYKPDPAADYELYSPAADGPAKLLRSANLDPADVETAYSRLRELEPGVAQIALTLIPDEQGGTQSSSLASQALLDLIPSIPLKLVREEYAVRFLKYKDVVEVEYSVNSIGNQAAVSVIPASSGPAFVHYAVEPERLTVEEEDGKFTTTIEVNGQVKDKAGRVVFQFTRKTPVSLTREQAARLGRRPVSFQGLFPLAEGDYDLSLILKNQSSKEFTTVEEKLVVPGPSEGLSATPILIGYGSKTEPEPPPAHEMHAFLLDGLQVYVSPANLFAPGDSLVPALELLGPVKARSVARTVRFDIVISGGRVVSSRTIALPEAGPAGLVSTALDLKGLPFGDHRLEASVLDASGRTLLALSAAFGLTPVTAVPRPLIFSDPLPGPGSPIHDFVLGGQYFNEGRLDRAEFHSGRAYRSEKTSSRYAVGYARVLLALGRFEETRDILKPFVQGDKPEASALEFSAEASRALGDCAAAARAYEDFLGRFGAKLSVFNGLGECYARMGDRAKAAAAYERSLALNPGQDDIRQALAVLKK